MASKPFIQLIGEESEGVVWTPTESKQLYLNARAWWANDKEAFDLEKEVDPFGLLDSIRKTLRRLGDFLARAVIHLK